METQESDTLKRDCQAVVIPAGDTVLLPSGTPFFVTQSLGGTFTIQAQGGLFRVAGRDADALGRERPEVGQTQAGEGLSEQQVWDVLKTCFDPEIPVNIVDLGLVYDLVIEPVEQGEGSRVSVKMTLTAPGCGMGPSIAGDAQNKILELPGVSSASVEIVWDPTWHHSMISAEGRRVLGLD